MHNAIAINSNTSEYGRHFLLEYIYLIPNRSANIETAHIKHLAAFIIIITHVFYTVVIWSMCKSQFMFDISHCLVYSRPCVSEGAKSRHITESVNVIQQLNAFGERRPFLHRSPQTMLRALFQSNYDLRSLLPSFTQQLKKKEKKNEKILDFFLWSNAARHFNFLVSKYIWYIQLSTIRHTFDLFYFLPIEFKIVINKNRICGSAE